MKAGHFDRVGVERRAPESRVSPRRLPFEGDGGRLYFGGNLSVEKGEIFLYPQRLRSQLRLDFFFLKIPTGLYCDKALE